MSKSLQERNMMMQKLLPSTRYVIIWRLSDSKYFIEAHFAYALNNSDKRDGSRWLSYSRYQIKGNATAWQYRTARQYIIYSAVWRPTSLHRVSRKQADSRFLPGSLPLRDLLFADNRETIRFFDWNASCVLLWAILCLRKISTSISRMNKIYKYKIS